MSEYLIQIRVKNNLLYSAIKEAGYNSIREFASKNKLHVNAINCLIRMEMPAINNRTGKYKDIVTDICAALNKSPEELFTEKQRTVNNGIKKDVIIAESEAKAYVAMIESCGNEFNAKDLSIRRAIKHSEY